MPSYLKQALFILAVVGFSKFVNKQLPNNPLDQFIAS